MTYPQDPYSPQGDQPQQPDPTQPSGYDQQGYPQYGQPQQPDPTQKIGSEPPAYPPGAAQPGDPYAAPPPGYQSYPQPPYAYQPVPQTNVMAILALVFAFIFAPVGIVLGHMAKKQIAQTGEEGGGLATAGLVLGYVFTGLYVLACCGYLVVAIVAGSNAYYG